MGVPGSKPSERPTVHRNQVTPWTDVVDAPYAGRVPTIPSRETVTDDGKTVKVPLSNLTRQWWKVVTRMPHCVLWSPSDWEFVKSTALVHDLMVSGVASAATELRNREKVLGTTVDSRRDLRIRYVPATDEPATAPVSTQEPMAGVVSMADERRRRALAS